MLMLAVFQPNLVGTFTCPPAGGKAELDNSKCALPGKDANAAVRLANAPTKKGQNSCRQNFLEVCCDDSITKNKITGKQFTENCIGADGKTSELKAAADPKNTATTKGTETTKGMGTDANKGTKTGADHKTDPKANPTR